MSIPSVVAACRSEILSLVKSTVRLLLWGFLIFIGVSAVFVLRHVGHILGVQTCVALGFMFVSLLAISTLAKRQTSDRKPWISVHTAILAVGIAAISWVPQWSGYIVGIALVLFAFTPNLLDRLAHGCATAGYERAAAFCARLACLFHPSKQFRFQLYFLAARALGSTDKKIAAYRAMVSHATPQQAVVLNCWISIDQDDWEGVLAQLRCAGDPTGLKWLEIRALGELGRVDEMIATYASAESVLSAGNLQVCRLYVLAYSGRTDAVCLLLNRQLRFVRPRNKAYWTFIADRAAGTLDEAARCALASHVRAADDETFRRTAQRHLDAGPTSGGVALSAESRATIEAIEKTLQKTKWG